VGKREWLRYIDTPENMNWLHTVREKKKARKKAEAAAALERLRKKRPAKYPRTNPYGSPRT
jgi:hypothetical protein